MNIAFAEVEHQVLKLWDELNAFQKSYELSKGRPEFSFYDVSLNEIGVFSLCSQESSFFS